MYNYQSSKKVFEGCNGLKDFKDTNNPVYNSYNKYVYIKQNLINPSHAENKAVAQKVLVNPHFKKKVYVNPNFKINPVAPVTVPKIHVNPNVQKLNINSQDCKSVQNIHINPNVLRNATHTLNTTDRSEPSPNNTIEHNVTKEICTAIPLVKIPFEKEKIAGNKVIKRRASVKSKYKIVKSTLLSNYVHNENERKMRASMRSKYKIIKSPVLQKEYPIRISKFKVDNRRTRIVTLAQKNRRYVYINRFLSVTDIARNSLLKRNVKSNKPGIINISGVLYKKSPNSLRRTTSHSKTEKPNKNKVVNCKSKYTFVKKSSSKLKIDLKEQSKSRRLKNKKNPSPSKLRKCNIPCPYYRKYGRCKGKDSGKCYRKHDPDQIALCTKFLQGACIDEKCLLSHNVSPEKMPTCNFYLEGSCSRDNCPYLHVRISPRADICKDFLEGYCRKASKCDKRHQFLCPEYEKHGSCPKQRCSYPHGKMVRKYSVFSKNEFAKKSSDCKTVVKNIEDTKVEELDKEILISEFKNINSNETPEGNIRNRYYLEQNHGTEDHCQNNILQNENKIFDDIASSDQVSGLKSRPKLGKLPSFIEL